MKRRLPVHEMGLHAHTLCGLKGNQGFGKQPILRSPAFSTITCPRCKRIAARSTQEQKGKE